MAVAVSGTVSALALTNSGLLIGGLFTSVSGSSATNIAMVDPTTGARVTSWSATANAEVKALALDGQRVFVGGLFTTLNGRTRRGLGALSVDSGATAELPRSLVLWVGVKMSTSAGSPATGSPP